MSQRLNQLLSFYENNPNEPFILFALAKEYESLENPDAAKEFYQLLVDNHPTYTGTYFHFVRLLHSVEETSLMMDIYQKGLAITKSEGDRHAFGELMGLGEEIGINE